MNKSNLVKRLAMVEDLQTKNGVRVTVIANGGRVVNIDHNDRAHKSCLVDAAAVLTGNNV